MAKLDASNDLWNELLKLGFNSYTRMNSHIVVRLKFFLKWGDLYFFAFLFRKPCLRRCLKPLLIKHDTTRSYSDFVWIQWQKCLRSIKNSFRVAAGFRARLYSSIHRHYGSFLNPKTSHKPVTLNGVAEMATQSSSLLTLPTLSSPSQIRHKSDLDMLTNILGLDSFPLLNSSYY